MANETVTQQPDIQLSLNDASLQEDEYIKRWDRSGLPPGIAWQMGGIEEAIAGLSGVTTILLRDLAHQEDSSASVDIKYTPLNGNDRSKLAHAVRSLVRAAEEGLESVHERLAERPSGNG